MVYEVFDGERPLIVPQLLTKCCPLPFVLHLSSTLSKGAQEAGGSQYNVACIHAAIFKTGGTI